MDVSGPSKAREAAEEIIRRLRGAGHEAYLAGGCVRDELLGVTPKDYDVATSAEPDAVRAIFPRSGAVGAAFGVVLVRLGGAMVEVATFREDAGYSDNRRPDAVVFSSAEHDAQRRDFTINALFLDPFASGDGVIDFVGGRADLDAGLVRAVGDPAERLREDHLRALRAVRFAARYGFTIEAATAEAVTAAAGDLAGVSRERIGDELRRMLTSPGRAEAVGLLGRLGLDGAVFGDAGGIAETATLAGVGEGALPLLLAAVAIDRGLDPRAGAARPRLVSRWRNRLCLSNAERSALSGTLRDLELLLGRWPSMGMAAQKRAAASGTFDDARRLLGVIDPERAAIVTDRLNELRASPGGLWPEPLISGDRLIELGLEPGPAMGRILEGVFDAQLEGRVRDSDEATALAMELAGRGGVE